jgi:DNA-binding response OmpR family regulator
MDILFLTGTDRGEMPSGLSLIPHQVRTAAPRTFTPRSSDHRPDVVLLDARSDLAGARSSSARLRSAGLDAPILAVMTESGLAALSPGWAVDGVVLTSAGPAEIDARLRLAVGHQHDSAPETDMRIRAGDLTIDPDTYSARVDGRSLDLAFKEFELLKLLASHPGRVFSRNQLTEDIWGPRYRGDGRTIDVHISRLRAKLGADHEQMIATVRRVGYKFVNQPHAMTANSGAWTGARA